MKDFQSDTHLPDGGMDHEEMRRRCFAELYLSGDLPAGEAEAFEEHFFDCEECQQDLAAARRIRLGLRGAGAANKPRTEQRWLWAGAGAAAALLLAAAPFWFA